MSPARPARRSGSCVSRSRSSSPSDVEERRAWPALESTLEIAMADVALCDGFDPDPIVSIEPADQRTVEIDYACYPGRTGDRHHQLRPRRRIAGNVTGEGVHILDQDRLPPRHRRAADSLSDGDGHAGRH